MDCCLKMNSLFLRSLFHCCCLYNSFLLWSSNRNKQRQQNLTWLSLQQNSEKKFVRHWFGVGEQKPSQFWKSTKKLKRVSCWYPQSAIIIHLVSSYMWCWKQHALPLGTSDLKKFLWRNWAKKKFLNYVSYRLQKNIHDLCDQNKIFFLWLLFFFFPKSRIFASSRNNHW